MVSVRRESSGSVGAFVAGKLPAQSPNLSALSVFSGAGIGDYGYRLAGFRFHSMADLDPRRLIIAKSNHPRAVLISGDLRKTWSLVVKLYRKTGRGSPPALLTGMPPCEAMSWAHSWTGTGSRNKFSHDPRNLLPFLLTRIANELKPRVVVFENVVGVFRTRVRDSELGKTDTVAQLVVDRLQAYECWPAVIQFADYGVPQRRQRALLTFLRRSDPAARVLLESGESPYPNETHDRFGRDGLTPWVIAKDFLGPPRFRRLDSRSAASARDPKDPLHSIPVYDGQRYDLVRSIPPHSGRSAYETDTCPACGVGSQPRDEARCWSCLSPLWTRPIVVGPRGGARLIVGSETAYSRMPSHLPVATVTTASGHLGSDAKIHPWENRLLSVRECAASQTIPRTFEWPSPTPRVNTRLLREVVGDAIPPWFTFLHGRVLRKLLLPGNRLQNHQ